MNELISTFGRAPWRHLKRLINDPHYRTLAYLLQKHGRVRQKQSRTIKFDGFSFIVPDVPSFLSAYYFIFVRKLYQFSARRPDPLIIDCGANVGLSVLYFKKSYPDARVIAYEADPNIFAVLEKNVSAQGLRDVVLVNAAIGASDGVVLFAPDGTDSGRVATNADCGRPLLQVPASRLRQLLEREHVDMLKLDIEGAEADALEDCVGKLGGVDCLFAEYHTFPGAPQRLGSVLNVLENEGFRVAIESVHMVDAPLEECNRKVCGGMDMQLHIYAYRVRSGSSA
jgi:FkbM family methyltransferase